MFNVSVEDEANGRQSADPPLPKPGSTPRHRIMEKNRKHWKRGDRVGCFEVLCPRLNMKGEMIQKCVIVNQFNDVCGSLFVTIVYDDSFFAEEKLLNINRKILSPSVEEFHDYQEQERLSMENNLEELNNNSIEQHSASLNYYILL